RYDVADIQKEDFESAVVSVFSEPPVDNVFFETLPDLKDYEIFGTEFLPGQYDQRADSAAQCVQLLTQKARPMIKCATIYAIKGVKEEELEKIKKYIINPVEARLCSLEKPVSLREKAPIPEPVHVIDGFIDMDREGLEKFHQKNGFAMSVEDLEVVRAHFQNEGRNPNEAELKVIDTYWSDHCRHTTFLTNITDVTIKSDNPHIEKAYKTYQELFVKFNGNKKDKYQCLMDIATIAAKELKSQGKLDNLDESDEINACSIVVNADIDGVKEEWLVMFKNETHNHPTEIEPFGGAATCLGGAIRDPLSGRVYVYQAMRITGAADPTVPIEQTMRGKLPQRVLTKTAAAGYSSYGNQIGLATGLVREVYHPNYVAKRLETGFVVGAAPKKNVIRQKPKSGDIVVLIGGETGRDGIGGATGSSKPHTEKSVDTAGAEVQKGNPLTERKIQRLFRNPEVTKLIKKCNDFGAGGVCVAIGELAPGLEINLNCIPKKYSGLNALELAVSESQERMAVVIDKDDFETLKKYADIENVSATIVARVNDSNRMTMFLDGEKVVDLDRSLLDSNGAKQYSSVLIEETVQDIFSSSDIHEYLKNQDYKNAILKKLSSLNVCSQKGLIEMFDSTIGAGSVIMPLGGKNQLTPADCMISRLPVMQGQTTTATVASWGFNPDMMSKSPFLGAVYSVVLSVMRAVAGGADPDSIRLTLQEYFLRLNKDPHRWGIPMSALLGAMQAQLGLKIGAIGGKDSMSGTFENIDVPPTLISFALGMTDTSYGVTNVLNKPGIEIVHIKLKRDEYGMPDFEYVNRLIRVLHQNIKNGNISYIQIIEEGGAAISAIKSALGNELGIKFYNHSHEMFDNFAGDCLVALNDINVLEDFDYQKLGITTSSETVINNQTISIKEIIESFTSTLEKVFPTTAEPAQSVKTITYDGECKKKHSDITFARPKVFIPVFPGTNCEYDTKRVFEQYGAEVNTFVIRNRTPQEIEESAMMMAKLINQSQIIAFPGGFSGGDEPDGSGKFIATAFKNPKVKEAVTDLIENRDGLIIGICNGFQALIKLGLLPYGKITSLSENSPTLTFNNIHRHMSSIVRTRICSVNSPWLNFVKLGDIYGTPISHGEGRFFASQNDLELMEKNGQIFSQYVDENGVARADMPYNPNGSVCAIEGIISPDGRILGKMAHIERCQKGYKNIDLNMDMKIFYSGVQYFK
ncbi:MAG TPA: phosphoribosylformylglycinamidine synthase, partial [Clostridia bacterium]